MISQMTLAGGNSLNKAILLWYIITTSSVFDVFFASTLKSTAINLPQPLCGRPIGHQSSTTFALPTNTTHFHSRAIFIDFDKLNHFLDCVCMCFSVSVAMYQAHLHTCKGSTWSGQVCYVSILALAHKWRNSPCSQRVEIISKPGEQKKKQSNCHIDAHGACPTIDAMKRSSSSITIRSDTLGWRILNWASNEKN